MVGSAGVEPARGRVYSSLHYRSANYPKVAYPAGIGPAQRDLEFLVLPLHYGHILGHFEDRGTHDNLFRTRS